MKNYYRIMLGKKSIHADECLQGSFIGADFDIDIDLTNDLTDNWKEFNKKFIPVYLKNFPDKKRISAGLACGALWTIAKGIQEKDIVLCPNGQGSYHVGEINGGYYYHAGEILPHRRNVQWYSNTIARSEMSEALQFSSGSIGTVSTISKYADEIERITKGEKPNYLIASDPDVEDPSLFALESHLEDFLVKNWKQTEFGKNYDIYEDENGTGKQYPTDDKGRIDILALSKNKKELLVVELKRGRASDVVVGQIQRYMGFVREVIAEKNQMVKGVIIASEDDLKIRRALSVTSNIEFYNYKLDFQLIKI